MNKHYELPKHKVHLTMVQRESIDMLGTRGAALAPGVPVL